MNIDQCRDYLLSLPEAVESFPFGPDVAVFKVCHKLFATLAVREGEPQMNLKCDPDQACALRDLFPSIVPGYHMNKKHWNTVYLDSTVPESELERMMDHSYSLVVKGLLQGERERLEREYGEEVLYRA